MGSKTYAGVVAPCLFFFLALAITARAHGVYDVTKYGAKADGITDDAPAFMNAWREACQSTNPCTILIPKGVYLAGPVVFSGPCRAPITVDHQGTVKARVDLDIFASISGWVRFVNVAGLTISGGGSFDGQGSFIWKISECFKTRNCSFSLPMNLKFDGVTNCIVKDIISLNSKLFHFNVHNCHNVSFSNIGINAPGFSPFTQGFNLGRSSGISITNGNIKTGDSCVSVGDGNKDIHIEKVTCGPGHGINIGGLGMFLGEQPVQGVKVKNCTFSNTMNGVRINTLLGSLAGFASNLHFEDLIMNNVGIPIHIDQMFCPFGTCLGQAPSKVGLSDIVFKGIIGVSVTEVAVRLVCSPGIPCSNVQMSDIDLAFRGIGKATCECANVKPNVTGPPPSPAICP